MLVGLDHIITHEIWKRRTSNVPDFKKGPSGKDVVKMSIGLGTFRVITFCLLETNGNLKAA